MARKVTYRVEVERTTVDTAVVEVELDAGLDPDEVDWSAAIEEHLDALAERPGAAPVEWELDSTDYDVVPGSDPEEVQ